MNRLAPLGVALLAPLPAFAQTGAFDPDALIIEARDTAELARKWCAANPQVEHVLVLPAALFVDSEQLICDGNPYKL